jgi:hypothetical protein
MKKMRALLVALFLAGILAACQKSSPSGTMLSEVERKTVLEFSEPEMDGIFDGWNKVDYGSFSKDFDQQVLKSMTREQFEKLRKDEFTGLGRYFSRDVESVVKRSDGSYTVIYSAIFENNGETLVRVTFRADEPHEISALQFEK